MDPILESLKPEDESLEKLTDELVQVFCFENIDNSTKTQKEELIQRILKLRGKDYTIEDLRRDLVSLEMEDNIKGQFQISEKVMVTEHKDKGNGKDNKEGLNLEGGDQSRLVN